MVFQNSFYSQGRSLRLGEIGQKSVPCANEKAEPKPSLRSLLHCNQISPSALLPSPQRAQQEVPNARTRGHGGETIEEVSKRSSSGWGGYSVKCNAKWRYELLPDVSRFNVSTVRKLTAQAHGAEAKGWELVGHFCLGGLVGSFVW